MTPDQGHALFMKTFTTILKAVGLRSPQYYEDKSRCISFADVLRGKEWESERSGESVPGQATTSEPDTLKRLCSNAGGVRGTLGWEPPFIEVQGEATLGKASTMRIRPTVSGWMPSQPGLGLGRRHAVGETEKDP
ncbi:hypothetical protein MMC31_005221 [Peltigera leucophlebia]|nr:hypothetical protein [Peltigera leucophlebia]